MWQRLEVVSPLEYGSDPGREPGAARRENAKTFLGQLHAAERIPLVRVEAGLDEQEVGLEGSDGWFDAVGEGLRVGVVA